MVRETKIKTERFPHHFANGKILNFDEKIFVDTYFTVVQCDNSTHSEGAVCGVQDRFPQVDDAGISSDVEHRSTSLITCYQVCQAVLENVTI